MNDLMGLNGITRKATLSCHIYDILSLYGEERRKGYDCHGRQATHARRGSRESSTICKNSQEVYPLKADRGSPGRQPLPSKGVGARPLSSQKYQTGNRQKIKPPERWQTRQFTAVRLFPKIGTRKEQPLLYPAYFLVYEPCLTMSRCRYTEWAHERKKVCS